MDAKTFDLLARSVSSRTSRRAALAALLAGLVGPLLPTASAAKRGRGRRGNRERKTKRRRGGNGGRQVPEPEPCCGTLQCDLPEAGGTRAHCDLAGRSFAGQDLNGSIFRRIDGRFANFSRTDLHGSVFAEACLFAASFRGARLGGSTWGGACLFSADFRDADLGGDTDALDGAVLCFTDMPDGTRNDRDCNHLPACCRPSLGGALPCNKVADCPDEDCQTKACSDGRCIYNACEAPTSNCCGKTCRECCTASQCTNPNEPICVTFQCVSERVATTFERVRTVVAELLGVDAGTITLDTEFMRDLGADSLDLVELILAMEDEFGITISDEDAEKIRTVGDAVRYIVEHGG